MRRRPPSARSLRSYFRNYDAERFARSVLPGAVAGTNCRGDQLPSFSVPIRMP